MRVIDSLPLLALPPDHGQISWSCSLRWCCRGVGGSPRSRKVDISNVERCWKQKITITLLRPIIPTLLRNIAPVQAVVASALLSFDHVASLYSADDVVFALNIAADVSDNAKVDQTMFPRAFANNTTDNCIPQYEEHFRRRGDNNVLYIRKETRTGRHKGK